MIMYKTFQKYLKTQSVKQDLSIYDLCHIRGENLSPVCGENGEAVISFDGFVSFCKNQEAYHDYIQKLLKNQEDNFFEFFGIFSSNFSDTQLVDFFNKFSKYG